MGRFGVCLVTLAVLTGGLYSEPVFADAKQPNSPAMVLSEDLTGLYRCEGEGYRGTVIIRRTGDTYQFLWFIGSDTHMGVGLREGTLISSSWQSAGMSVPGIVVYQVEKDNKLVGRYSSYPGNGQVGTETLTYIGPAE